MDIGIIALIAMIILGGLMFFAPEICTKAEQRDDPDAVAQIKKLGVIFMIGAVIAGLYMLKYKLM